MKNLYLLLVILQPLFNVFARMIAKIIQNQKNLRPVSLVRRVRNLINSSELMAF